MRNGLQDSGVNYSYSAYSASSQYQNPSQGQSNYPFEAAFEQQSNTAQQSQAFATQYAPQTTYTTQVPQFRAQEYAAPAPVAPPPQSAGLQGAGPGVPVQSSLPAYADQLQQSYDNYQQEQQMQQLLAQQQQQQERLLLDLYKTPQGQGRPVTENGGRGGQAFYTADQYINFLNRQHQDVFRQQQNHSERGTSYSPMSAYTNGLPANTTSNQGGLGTQYSPASNVSTVNYSNGKLTYNY